MVSEVKAHYPIIFVEVKLKMYILDLPRGRIKNRWGGEKCRSPSLHGRKLPLYSFQK